MSHTYHKWNHPLHRAREAMRRVTEALDARHLAPYRYLPFLTVITTRKFYDSLSLPHVLETQTPAPVDNNFGRTWLGVFNRVVK